MIRDLAVLITAIGVLGSGACGGKGKTLDGPGEALPGPHRETRGLLREAVDKLQASEYREACDTDPETVRQQIELADALDQHAEEIKRIDAAKPLREGFKRVPFGPVTIVEQPEAPAYPEEWKEYESSWAGIYASYLEIKDKPVDLDWVYLNSDVRGLIPNDEDRLEGYNLALDEKSEPMLRQAISEIAACAADKACVEPKFTSPLAEKLENDLYFGNLLYWIRKHTEVQAKHDRIEWMRDKLESSARRYELRKVPAVNRSSPTTLTVSLDAGVFVGAREQIAAYIEDTWKSPDFRVQVEWRAATADENSPYKLLLEPGVGGRASVSWDDRVIRLFDQGRVGTLVHEIGHVLGFRDRYFTIWRPGRCSYVERSNRADIMSNSFDGRVLPEHFKSLSERYPLAQ